MSELQWFTGKNENSALDPLMSRKCYDDRSERSMKTLNGLWDILLYFLRHVYKSCDINEG